MAVYYYDNDASGSSTDLPRRLNSSTESAVGDIIWMEEVASDQDEPPQPDPFADEELRDSPPSYGPEWAVSPSWSIPGQPVILIARCRSPPGLARFMAGGRARSRLFRGR